jgi:WD40 repeat protein
MKTEFLPCFCIPHRNCVIFFLGARIGVWNVNTSTIVQRFSDAIIFELLPWENSILAGGPDSTITVWSLDTLVPIRKIMLPIFCEGIAVMSRWDENCIIVSNADSNDYLLVYDIVNETEKQTISGVFDEISVLSKMKDDKVVHITIDRPGYELTILDSKVNTVVFSLVLKSSELGYRPYSISGSIIALQDGDVIKIIDTDKLYQIVQIDNCDEAINLCTS